MLYDLGVGRADAWPDAEAAMPPAPSAGRPSGKAASARDRLPVAKPPDPTAMKGGLGTASERTPAAASVELLVAVNAVGEQIVDPETGHGRPASATEAEAIEAERSSIDLLRARHAVSPLTAENTTIGVVATDVALDRATAAPSADGPPACARQLAVAHTGRWWTRCSRFNSRFAGEPPT
ncbi:MAG: P1 family peptidase [Dehalococcoidia bacterium]